MLWFYVQQIVFLVVGATLFAISSVLAILIYIGFGVLLAVAIRQLLKAIPAESTASRQSSLESAPIETLRTPLMRQHIDWAYLGKQARLGFFRGIGFILLLAAAPFAFAQQIPGVGIMALATAAVCLWLGFHRKSPLVIKVASLADEETN